MGTNGKHWKSCPALDGNECKCGYLDMDLKGMKGIEGREITFACAIPASEGKYQIASAWRWIFIEGGDSPVTGGENKETPGEAKIDLARTILMLNNTKVPMRIQGTGVYRDYEGYLREKVPTLFESEVTRMDGSMGGGKQQAVQVEMPADESMKRPAEVKVEVQETAKIETPKPKIEVSKAQFRDETPRTKEQPTEE